MKLFTNTLRKMPALALFAILSFAFSRTNAQTVLARGDVAFVSCQTNNSTADTFAIVLLKNIASGTQIGFTDGNYKDANGYNSLTSTKNEWYFVWEASGALPAGTIIKYWTSIAVASNAGGLPNASTGTIVQGVGLSLNHNGGTDQVFAFQGINSLDTSSTYRLTVTRYLAGIHLDYIGGLTSDANWDGTASAGGLFQSELPDSLVTGTHAIRFDSSSVKRENAVMTSNILSLDKSVINNKANWTFGNTPQTRATPLTITWNGTSWSGARSSTMDAIIQSNTTPGTFTCRSIRIDNGYSATITSGNLISIYGDVFNYGTTGFAGDGDVEFYKTGTANIYGNEVKFSGIFRVSSSTTLATNNLLRLTATGASTYGQIGSGGSLNGAISGNLTCEYYIGSGGYGWRNICSPVNGATLAEINDDIPLFFGAPTSYNNVFTFNEASSSPRWTNPSSVSQSMNAGGFAVYFRDNTAPVTIDITGTYNGTSNYVLSGLTRTGSSTDTSGWHIIRNPWPTGFYWDGSIANVQGTAAYIYDQTAGTYTTFDNINDGIIPPFAAITIKVTSNNVSVTLPNNSRNVALGNNFFDKTIPVQNYVSLSLKNLQTGIKDEARFYTDMKAQNGYDELDGPKLMNPLTAPNIYFINGTENVNKEVWSSIPSAGVHLPVALNTESIGLHEISYMGENIELGTTIYLEDKTTKKLYDITKGAYTFDYTTAGVLDRFVLHIANTTSTTGIENAQVATYFIGSDGSNVTIGTTADENLKVEITDLLGRVITANAYTASAGTTASISANHTATGYYIVKVTGNSGVQTAKVFLK